MDWRGEERRSVACRKRGTPLLRGKGLPDIAAFKADCMPGGRLILRPAAFRLLPWYRMYTREVPFQVPLSSSLSKLDPSGGGPPG